MNRFYFLIWLQWAVKLTLYTFLLAFFIAFCVTLFIYVMQGMQPLEVAIKRALLTVFGFWFFLSWNFSLLIILFRSVKYIFNRCIHGYELKLLGCPSKENKEQGVISEIGYGDLVKVWRKWFMLMIWIVAAQMIVVVIMMKLLSGYENVFDWFNIYVLYIFILVAGYFSLIILSMKCKKVRIVKC